MFDDVSSPERAHWRWWLATVEKGDRGSSSAEHLAVGWLEQAVELLLQDHHQSCLRAPHGETAASRVLSSRTEEEEELARPSVAARGSGALCSSGIGRNSSYSCCFSFFLASPAVGAQGTPWVAAERSGAVRRRWWRLLRPVVACVGSKHKEPLAP